MSVASSPSFASAKQLPPGPPLESWRERLRAQWRGPRSCTVLLPVTGIDAPSLRTRLAPLAGPLRAALSDLPGLHTFRLVVVPADPCTGHGPRLLLNTVHDQPRREHLALLVTRLRAPLTAVLSAAGQSAASPDEQLELLAHHRVRESTLHLGAINQTVASIHANACLNEAAGRVLDARLTRDPWPTGTSAETIRRDVRAQLLREHAEATSWLAPRAPLSPLGRLGRALSLVKSFLFPAMGVLDTDIAAAADAVRSPVRRALAHLGYGLWWIYGAIPTGLALLFTRLVERLEPDLPTPTPDDETLARLEASEDLQLKNEVTLWFPVKPSWARRLLLAVILWGSERGCRHCWTRGALAGIDTIHYARLLRVDRGRTFIFLSDYDGSLSRYLDDFVGVGSRAVIPISSNVTGCPPVRWLFHQVDPATFNRRWRTLIRVHQLEATVWHSAYPQLTVTDILAHAQLRDWLAAETLPEAEARRWARAM